MRGVWPWHWNQKPNYSNWSVHKTKERKKHVKYGQMWTFCSLLSSIAMARCIMTSWHKFVRSMRNIILKLCIDCVKHRYLCVSFWPKTEPYCGVRWLFLLPKTRNADKRKAFYYDWEHKRKIETRAVRDTIKHVPEMSRGLEKTLA